MKNLDYNIEGMVYVVAAEMFRAYGSRRNVMMMPVDGINSIPTK